jgi:hypothetical protein
MQTRAASLRVSASPELPAPRYHVDVLSWAEVGDHGVSYLNGSRRETLQWASILYGLAAEVGEPEGVRTVVIDLVVERKGRECVVCRFDAEPGLDAQEVAMQIAASLGRARCSRSLLALACDGAASRQVPDLEALDEQVIAELGL